MPQWLPNVWNFIRGNDEEAILHMLDVDKSPINLTGATAITLKIIMNDGSVLRKAAVTGFSHGVFRPIFIYGFAFTPDETLAMKLGLNQTVEMEIAYNALTKTFPIFNCLNVANEVITG